MSFPKIGPFHRNAPEDFPDKKYGTLWRRKNRHGNERWQVGSGGNKHLPSKLKATFSWHVTEATTLFPEDVPAKEFSTKIYNYLIELMDGWKSKMVLFFCLHNFCWLLPLCIINLNVQRKVNWTEFTSSLPKDGATAWSKAIRCSMIHCYTLPQYTVQIIHGILAHGCNLSEKNKISFFVLSNFFLNMICTCVFAGNVTVRPEVRIYIWSLVDYTLRLIASPPFFPSPKHDKTMSSRRHFHTIIPSPTYMVRKNGPIEACETRRPLLSTWSLLVLLQLRTKHMAPPGGATSNRLDRPKTV